MASALQVLFYMQALGPMVSEVFHHKLAEAQRLIQQALSSAGKERERTVAATNTALLLGVESSFKQVVALSLPLGCPRELLTLSLSLSRLCAAP